MKSLSKRSVTTFMKVECLRNVKILSNFLKNLLLVQLVGQISIALRPIERLLPRATEIRLSFSITESIRGKIYLANQILTITRKYNQNIK